MEEFQRFLGLVLTVRGGSGANLTYASTLYPKSQGLFARPVDPDNPEELEPVVGRWGVVPFFHKGPATTWKASTNNARSEEMLGNPKSMWRPLLKSRRCIIPATAFFEWTGPKGSKTKHRITRADGGPLFFAGLWADHAFEGERTESYTMVMQAADGQDDMAPFHNRQPVILTPESARAWLDLKADPALAIQRPPPGTLEFDPPEPAVG